MNIYFLNLDYFRVEKNKHLNKMALYRCKIRAYYIWNYFDSIATGFTVVLKGYFIN